MESADSPPVPTHPESSFAYRPNMGVLCAYLVVGLAVYASVNWMLIWDLTASAASRSVTKSAILLCLLLIGFAGVLLGPLAVRGVIRALFALLFVTSIASNLVVYSIVGSPPTRPAAVWLFSEVGQLSNLLQAWGWTIAGWTAVSVAAVITLIFVANRLRHAVDCWLSPHGARRLRITSVLVIIAMPLVGGASHVNLAPAEINAYAFGLVAMSMRTPTEAAPSLVVTGTPAAEKIVLVVDESTRPDVFAKVALPQVPWPKANFGTAYSSANCSAASNAFIRLGIEPSRMDGHQDPRTQSSIWAYARLAGFHTVMMDGQIDSAQKAQNFLGEQERSMIDELLAMKAGPDTDSAMAVELARRLAKPGREFIYMVMHGNHFPYAHNLPDAERDQYKDLKAVYAASVAHSTGSFFRRLAELDPTMSNTLLFYTSDHGQYQGGGATHCRADGIEDQFEVPMVVTGEASPFLSTLTENTSCWAGGANHQALRTTVLEAMGFARADLDAKLFPSLSTCPTVRVIPRFIGSLPFLTAADDQLAFESLPFRTPRGSMGGAQP